MARLIPCRADQAAAVIVTLLMAVGCGPSQEDLDNANSEITRLRGELESAESENTSLESRMRTLEAQNGEMASRLRALGQNVEDLEGERSNLQANLEETRRALEELRARERAAQARLQTFRNLLGQFRSMIESGTLRVRIVRNRMVVELNEGILFDSGRAELKREGQAALEEIAGVLTQIPNREFQIAGHTDNIPIRNRRFRNNWDLSTARAVNVARFLIEKSVPANRISAAGHAETAPVASNDTPEGRQQNRRIEIVLLPNLDELPDLSSLEGETST